MSWIESFSLNSIGNLLMFKILNSFEFSNILSSSNQILLKFFVWSDIETITEAFYHLIPCDRYLKTDMLNFFIYWMIFVDISFSKASISNNFISTSFNILRSIKFLLMIPWKIMAVLLILYFNRNYKSQWTWLYLNEYLENIIEV